MSGLKQSTDSAGPDLATLGADFGRSNRLLGVGDWSRPVTDPAGYKLRGRLLVFGGTYDARNSATMNYGAPVYLELQNLSGRINRPAGVFSDRWDGPECWLHDRRGKPVPTPKWISYAGSVPPSQACWTSVPVEGSIWLRVDAGLAIGLSATSRSGDVFICMGGGRQWTIASGDTNTYFLSGTFSPPTHHPVPPGYHVWEGTLKLPPVAISAPQ